MPILERLPFHTSLGHVVIGTATGDGCVEVSGPTLLAEVAETARHLRRHGAEVVLVDGAINRLGSAAPRVSDALIMATGGMVADTLDEVVETTVATPRDADAAAGLPENAAAASRSSPTAGSPTHARSPSTQRPVAAAASSWTPSWARG